MQTILSLLALLGLGSIIAALISWRVAISNHRQAWINALRDDLATYLRELESMHYVIGDLWLNADPDSEKKKREARIAILFVYWRIVMRLNRTETAHVELRDKLDGLMTVTERVPNRDQLEQTVDLARRILKREWDVTKHGMLTDSMLCLKKRWRVFQGGWRRCE
jgi:hypothetical protein